LETSDITAIHLVEFSGSTCTKVGVCICLMYPTPKRGAGMSQFPLQLSFLFKYTVHICNACKGRKHVHGYKMTGKFKSKIP